MAASSARASANLRQAAALTSWGSGSGGGTSAAMGRWCGCLMHSVPLLRMRGISGPKTGTFSALPSALGICSSVESRTRWRMAVVVRTEASMNMSTTNAPTIMVHAFAGGGTFGGAPGPDSTSAPDDDSW